MREAEGLIGNPGGIHAEAVAAKEVLENARDKVAHELGAKSREIIFTSGLTESINLAILGSVRRLTIQGQGLPLDQGLPLYSTHWVVSSIEHSAVLESFAEIERLGGTVTHLDPDERGIFTAENVAQAIRSETVLVSLGWANNEIGAVQPIRDISRAVKAKNPKVLLHSDAGQAPLYLSPQVHTLGVDLMSFGSNKLYGPHGVGALYAGKNAAIAPIILGGGQERGLRSGTENVALAAGFAAAFQQITKERESESLRLQKLRDTFTREIIALIPSTVVNGDLKRSLPHMLNISIPNIQSEYVALSLDQKGIAISTKSACAEGGAKESHVVAALVSESWKAENTLRFSLGRETTKRDLEEVVKTLVYIFQKTKG